MKKSNLKLIVLLSIIFVFNSNANESDSPQEQESADSDIDSAITDMPTFRCAPYPDCAGSESISYLELLIDQLNSDSEIRDDSNTN